MAVPCLLEQFKFQGGKVVAIRTRSGAWRMGWGSSRMVEEVRAVKNCCAGTWAE